MSHKLKAGDRVRFVVPCHLRGCEVGDKATVREQLNVAIRGARFFLVSMDKAVQVQMAPIFAEDEIEPDV
jgi:hypothetical protein